MHILYAISSNIIVGLKINYHICLLAGHSLNLYDTFYTTLKNLLKKTTQ